MKSLKNILAILTGLAALACIYLWGLQLSREGVSTTVYVGLGAAVAALVLLILLLAVQMRYTAARERRHQEETAALEEQHAQALEEARARNQAEMEAFRNSMSHTLRMPVAIIQGYAELLSSGVVTDSEVAAEYLKKISQRSQYMTEAISRQFSASDTVDSSKLTFSQLDLIPLLRQAAADMQSAAEERGVRIQVVSPEEHLTIEADAYLLNRVLYNLLENSLKYMGRPGVITIRALPQEDSVSLLVQDDGLGLPAEETAHVFEPNFQGSNHVVGQGYGLYLVRRAIEAHGGTVAAQSAPGRGMGISMTLPLTHENA